MALLGLLCLSLLGAAEDATVRLLDGREKLARQQKMAEALRQLGQAGTSAARTLHRTSDTEGALRAAYHALLRNPGSAAAHRAIAWGHTQLALTQQQARHLHSKGSPTQGATTPSSPPGEGDQESGVEKPSGSDATKGALPSQPSVSHRYSALVAPAPTSPARTCSIGSNATTGSCNASLLPTPTAATRVALVVYTAIFTDDAHALRDLLKPAGAPAGLGIADETAAAGDEVRFVCFTNSYRVAVPPAWPGHDTTGGLSWELHYQPLLPGLGGRKSARYYKAMPHKVLASIGLQPMASLWMDPTHVLLSSPLDLVRRFLLLNNTPGERMGERAAAVPPLMPRDAGAPPAAGAHVRVEGGGGGDIAVHAHNDRQCVFSEVEACITSKKDSATTLAAQARHYRAQGLVCDPITARGGAAPGRLQSSSSPAQSMARGELADTAVMLRVHSDRVQHFNELWWAELSTRSVRDQVSFPFVTWKSGVVVRKLPGTIRDGSALRLPPSPYFRNLYHSNVRYAGGTLRFGPAALSVGYDAAKARAEAEKQERASDFE